MIQSNLADLARAGGDEWRLVKERLDRRLGIFEIPTAADLLGERA